jgi:hypothetical protein
MKTIIKIILAVLFGAPLFLAAQESDSVRYFQNPIHKNVIKFNPTPMFLWSMKNVTFSYERILNPKQSIALTLGYLNFQVFLKIR